MNQEGIQEKRLFDDINHIISSPKYRNCLLGT